MSKRQIRKAVKDALTHIDALPDTLPDDDVDWLYTNALYGAKCAARHVIKAYARKHGVKGFEEPEPEWVEMDW